MAELRLRLWSVKAEERLRSQYAAVRSAGRAAMGEAVVMLERATDRLEDAQPLVAEYTERAQFVHRYTNAYRACCWNVSRLIDLRLAPFHLLASEGKVHTDRDHR